MRIWVVHVVQVLSSACDVLDMSVVGGVGGVCEMCMCLGWEVLGVNGCEDWVWVFTNPGGTG